MEFTLLLIKIGISTLFLGFLSIILKLLDDLMLKPQKLRSKLRKQGIRGPPPSFLLGNIPEMRKIKSKSSQEGKESISHNCSSLLFPFFHQWTQQYGSTFMYSSGNKQILHMNDPEMVKELITCTSLDLGKPSYQEKERGPLLGQGILTSNGAVWAHQRKILAPELYMEKVKGMTKLMVESSITLVNSWKRETEFEGGVADIKIDGYMRSFSGDAISKACFGSNYSKGEEIFIKLRALQEVMSKKSTSLVIPGIRHLPTKSKRETRRLEKEIRALVLKVVKERKETSSEKDLLQMILEGATIGNNIESDKDAVDRFIVDNCKNIYFAGNETTAVTATWTLMLLALNPSWQEKVREEVLTVCRGQLPDSDMIRKMKTLTMVINESLRLYPPVAVITREALNNMKFGGIYVPKGVLIWTSNVALHHDPEIWGPDADKFNPERFTNGVSGACKLPYVYMPFGVGPRTCLGHNFAMAELKILLSLIVSNFSFSLSPKYRHSPILKLLIEPEHGVDILVKKL